jgi:hypothetical protein
VPTRSAEFADELKPGIELALELRGKGPDAIAQLIRVDHRELRDLGAAEARGHLRRASEADLVRAPLSNVLAMARAWS